MASGYVRACSLLVAFVLSFSVSYAKEWSFYDLSAFDIDGRPVSFGTLRGRVSLVINVASFCGLTKQNYEELVQLHDKYGPKGFTVLAFPCNQFNQQEPKSNAEIKQFALVNYTASFPMFAKVTVNEPMCADGRAGGFRLCSASSVECCAANNRVYDFLKAALPGVIDWNFAKFLISKEGVPLKRYEARTVPFDLVPDIEDALRKNYVYSS